ncbi:unnamed protein product [Eruca vesicaria subsp. sativa]|uniref:Protein kinase domain-containing protein n=1 Tax=Eruca vesicaria subsp. sativa TaxID=29727 RepID=A0ABC8JSW5_ERUVS|nr:unnamed protein product [Eruca vesicaria subsp. sativa]
MLLHFWLIALMDHSVFLLMNLLLMNLFMIFFMVGIRKGVRGAQPGHVMSWNQRIKIAVGAARGLEYLHEKANPHVVHRDIKSSNKYAKEDDLFFCIS